MSSSIHARVILRVALWHSSAYTHFPLVFKWVYGDCMHKELSLASSLALLNMGTYNLSPPLFFYSCFTLSLVCQCAGAAVLALSLGGWLLCECWQQGPCWGNEDGCPRVGRAGCFVVSLRTMRRFLEMVEERHRNTANTSPRQKNVSFRRDSLSLN